MATIKAEILECSQEYTQRDDPVKLYHRLVGDGASINEIIISKGAMILCNSRHRDNSVHAVSIGQDGSVIMHNIPKSSLDEFIAWSTANCEGDCPVEGFPLNGLGCHAIIGEVGNRNVIYGMLYI